LFKLGYIHENDGNPLADGIRIPFCEDDGNEDSISCMGISGYNTWRYVSTVPYVWPYELGVPLKFRPEE
jgi:hypothetical protein